MIVDVTYNNMTFQESVVDCIRRVDAIIHEAEMGVMIDKYMYLQENGVVLEGDQAKTSIRNRIRSMVDGVIRTLVNFIGSVKKKLIAKFNAIKAKSDQKKAAKIDKAAKKTAKTFDRVSNEFSDEMNGLYNVINLDDEDDFNKVTDRIKERHNVFTNVVNQAYSNIMDNQRKMADDRINIDEMLNNIGNELEEILNDLTKD